MDSQPVRPPIVPTGGAATAPVGTARKRKNHRGGKKRKPRQKSFAAVPEEGSVDGGSDAPRNTTRDDFYDMPGETGSNTSLDSRGMHDHREQQHFFRPRRSSVAGLASTSFQAQPSFSQSTSRLRTVYDGDSAADEEQDTSNESAPLLSSSNRPRLQESISGYGANEPRNHHHSRRNSSKASSRRLGNAFASFIGSSSFNVNYPPSMPGSPRARPSDRELRFDDAVLRDDMSLDAGSPGGGPGGLEAENPSDRLVPSPLERRHTFALEAEGDVCFPHEGMSEMADDDHSRSGREPGARTRRRRRRWPELSILDEWSRFEKEGRTDERKAKTITEPQLINGRLRNVHKSWYRTEEDAPYRFTYFNEEFPSTIHAQTISELVQPGGSFRELFVPDRPVLEDSSESESDDETPGERPDMNMHRTLSPNGLNGESKPGTRVNSVIDAALNRPRDSEETQSTLQKPSGSSRHSQQASTDTTPARFRSPSGVKSPPDNIKFDTPPRLGERPVWWLDILSPTEAEMRVISKAFGIHPLTAEDIMLQEAREKVELFRHYYFVNYRTFDQDQSSENYLEPVDMYVVVFREGVLSFHFSETPHAANVRRRIRQLKDYLILSSDWISYAIIDDITDVFVPLIQNIEDEVDDIDDAILRLHSDDPVSLSPPSPTSTTKKEKEKGVMFHDKASETADSEVHMLRRVGDCRKKVMGLYRLLGNKADVIKGFAKRCNEQWEVAPRSEIGLYLGDIQDHIVTMTSNLGHYEKILARSHGNYLAQINIRMNERQEQTADVLGKLTVLGTIVLPMNIITGLWGMNVWVPGQEYEGDLKWFVVITAGLMGFGLACYLIAKRVYNIV